MLSKETELFHSLYSINIKKNKAVVKWHAMFYR